MATAKPVVDEAPVELAAPVATSAEALSDERERERMRAYFSKQKRIPIRVKEDQFVQVNGYTFFIKANQKVEVPEDIYHLLDEAGRL